MQAGLIPIVKPLKINEPIRDEQPHIQLSGHFLTIIHKVLESSHPLTSLLLRLPGRLGDEERYFFGRGEGLEAELGDHSQRTAGPAKGPEEIGVLSG